MSYLCRPFSSNIALLQNVIQQFFELALPAPLSCSKYQSTISGESTFQLLQFPFRLRLLSVQERIEDGDGEHLSDLEQDEFSGGFSRV